jgi:hypothetical protein
MKGNKMKSVPKTKVIKEQKITESIDKLLIILNTPETNCIFWKVNEPDAHIMGIRPVTRTTIEIINENGFNPYEKKTPENLFKCFKIFIMANREKNLVNQDEIAKKKEIEKNGIIYIKSSDLIYIFDTIRRST